MNMNTNLWKKLKNEDISLICMELNTNLWRKSWKRRYISLICMDLVKQDKVFCADGLQVMILNYMLHEGVTILLWSRETFLITHAKRINAPGGDVSVS